MNIQFATPPAGGLQLVQDRVNSIHQRRQQRSLAGGSDAVAAAAMPQQAAQAVRPFPIYTYPLDELCSDLEPQPPRLVGWRYLLVDQDQVVEVADVAQDAAGGAPKFLGLSRGRVVQATTEAVAIAEQVAGAQFELRGLEVPSVYASALWLKAQRPSEDRFIPMSPLPGLTVNQPCTNQELHQALKTAALAVKDHDNRPQGVSFA